MKGSLVIVGFFVLGILAGLSGIVPEKIVEGNLTFYALCALLFFVGIGVGSDRNIVSRFKSLDVRMALLPAGTMLGTFAGALAAALILPGRSATDCLAVGSGFGYYSLSSIFITGYRGAELGTVALLSNIIREMATLLLAPLLVRIGGPLAPIAPVALHRWTPHFRSSWHPPARNIQCSLSSMASSSNSPSRSSSHSGARSDVNAGKIRLLSLSK